MKKSKYIIISLLSLIFILNTILVILNLTSPIDDFFHNIMVLNNSEMLTKIMHIITFMGSTKFIILIGLVILITFIVLKQKAKGVSATVVLIISTLINNLIKIIIQRPRPEYISVIEKTFSYPSGHSMASMSLYGFLIYLIIKSNLKRFDKILLCSLLGLLILGIGISRMYLGAHFFTDVFGGFILSIILILIFDLINDKKKFI